MIKPIKSEVQHHLGLTEPRPGSVKLKLSEFVDNAALSNVPSTFGHENAVPSTSWGMLGNDKYGDCVWAGAAHEHMLWNSEAGKVVAFTDADALKAYSAVTGFKASDPSTDNGTDMDAAAKYRRKTGIHDASNKVHKVAAYVDLQVGNLQEFLYAAYWFGAVGIGIRFPAFAMEQFNSGKPWDVQTANSSIEGGHYIPGVARRNGVTEILTWGRVQSMTDAFFQKYCDQGVAYLSEEIMNGAQKTPEGLDLVGLQKAFADVTA